MLLLSALSLIPHATAGVTGDLQLRAMPSAARFMSTWVEELDPVLAYDDLGDTYDCWDRVGIQDFNLSIPIDTVDVRMDTDIITVDVTFGDIVGTNMLIYTLDADYLDSCPELSADMRLARLTGGHVSLGLRAIEQNGELSFEVVGNPVVEGDLVMDIDWVPDDLLLYFLEDTIFQSIEDSIATEVGPALSDFFGTTLYAGEASGYDMNLTLDDLALSADGLDLGLGLDMQFVGEPACTLGEAPAASGRSPSIAFSAPPDADLGVGLTEGMVNEVMHEAWDSGAFCVEPSGFAELTEDMEDLVDPSVTSLHGDFSLASPPTIELGARAARMTLTGAKLAMTGTVDGADAEVLSVTMNIGADAEFGTDASLSSVVLGLSGLEISFTDFSANHLRTDPYTEDLVGDAVRRFAANWIAGWLQNIVLFDSLYTAWDIGMRIESLDTTDGGLVVWASLWDLDDPSVDKVAPDTTAEVTEQSGETVTLAWDGTDDKATKLAYSVQIDGGGWSGWTGEAGGTFDLAYAGSHVIEVKARDEWQNEDPSPVSLEVDASAKNSSSACGCDASGSPFGAWLAVAGLALARCRGRGPRCRSGDARRRRD